jgi:RNA polymerase sigma factor (sigma-70 family)
LEEEKKDMELWASFLDGDKSALDALYKKHQRTVLNAISKHLNITSVGGTLSVSGNVLANDAANIAWEHIHKALINGKFEARNESSFRSFISKIARNKALDFITQAKKNRSTSLIVGGTNEFPRLDDFELASPCFADEDPDELPVSERLIPYLSEIELDVFALMKDYYFSDEQDNNESINKITSVEMAEILGVNERTIRNRRKSIQEKLVRLKNRIDELE